jgi:hypothetical protein
MLHLCGYLSAGQLCNGKWLNIPVLHCRIVPIEKLKTIVALERRKSLIKLSLLNITIQIPKAVLI